MRLIWPTALSDAGFRGRVHAGTLAPRAVDRDSVERNCQADCGSRLERDCATLDAEAFGADRLSVLRWGVVTGPPNTRGSSGQVEIWRGFVLGRHGHNSEHIGPVVARSAEAAAELVTSCLARVPERPVTIDAPDAQEAFTRTLRIIGLHETAELHADARAPTALRARCRRSLRRQDLSWRDIDSGCSNVAARLEPARPTKLDRVILRVERKLPAVFAYDCSRPQPSLGCGGCRARWHPGCCGQCQQQSSIAVES